MGKELQCTECAFMVRSENEDEVVDFVQRHARENHDQTMARSDVERLWKTV